MNPAAEPSPAAAPPPWRVKLYRWRALAGGYLLLLIGMVLDTAHGRPEKFLPTTRNG